MKTATYILDREKLHKHMKLKGFSSLREFAQSASIHRNTLQPYLKGEASVFRTSFIEIASALGVDPISLVNSAVSEESKGADAIELKRYLTKLSEGDRHVAFVLFGSRAEGRARRFSDWDIGVTRGSNPLSSSEFLAMKSQLEDLVDDFPYVVDLVNLDAAPRWFLEEMSSSPKLFSGNQVSYEYFRGMLHGIQKK